MYIDIDILYYYCFGWLPLALRGGVLYHDFEGLVTHGVVSNPLRG